MSTSTLVTIEAETCYKCGVVFGLAREHRAELRRSHATFYCPNGHGQHYPGPSEAEQLRKQLAEQKRHAEWYRSRLLVEQGRAETLKRSRAATRGQLTKLQRRVAAGRCPCCRATFDDLGQHMTAEHPDYPTTPEDET